MRQVVNGKLYDTDKMTLLWASKENEVGVGYETRIYITPKSRTIVRRNLTRWQGEHDSMDILSLTEVTTQYPSCAEWMPDDILAQIPAAQ